MGTPNRWVEPMAMSAPISPGGVNRQSAKGSAAMTARALASCRAAMGSRKSWNAPFKPGYWNSAPKTAAGSRSLNGSPTMISISNGSARVRSTDKV